MDSHTPANGDTHNASNFIGRSRASRSVDGICSPLEHAYSVQDLDEYIMHGRIECPSLAFETGCSCARFVPARIVCLRGQIGWSIQKTVLISAQEAGFKIVEFLDYQANEYYSAFIADFIRHGLPIDQWDHEDLWLRCDW